MTTLCEHAASLPPLPKYKGNYVLFFVISLALLNASVALCMNVEYSVGVCTIVIVCLLGFTLRSATGSIFAALIHVLLHFPVIPELLDIAQKRAGLQSSTPSWSISGEKWSLVWEFFFGQDSDDMALAIERYAVIALVICLVSYVLSFVAVIVSIINYRKHSKRLMVYFTANPLAAEIYAPLSAKWYPVQRGCPICRPPATVVEVCKYNVYPGNAATVTPNGDVIINMVSPTQAHQATQTVVAQTQTTAPAGPTSTLPVAAQLNPARSEHSPTPTATPAVSETSVIT